MDRQQKVLAICLGAIAAIGPLSMDMYLAAMPAMAADLGAADGEIEMTVMAFFTGFCAGQLVLGPLSDRTGRKPVVYGGLALFILASIGCILAATVPQLMAWRLLQGVGGSIGMVIAMSSVRDIFTGAQAARMMGMVVIVIGLAPVIAPVLGSSLLTVAPWQAIFSVLALAGALVLLFVWRFMPETRDREARANSHPSKALKTYGKLLFDGDFIPYAGALALTQGGFFAYISAASVVLITHYGMSPLGFSIAFAINAIGMTATAQLGGMLIGRIGAVRLARLTLAARAALGMIMAGLALAGTLNLSAFLLLCFLLVASLGFAMPACSMLALDRQGAVSGTASALMGAMGFGSGALVSLIIGILADNSGWPISLMMALTALGAMAIAQFAFSDDVGVERVPASTPGSA